MPKPKKQQPFILFCEKQKKIDPTLQGKSLAEITEHCGQTWRCMSSEERKEYMIKSARGDCGDPPSRTNSPKKRLMNKSWISQEDREKLKLKAKYYDAYVDEAIWMKAQDPRVLSTTRLLVISVHVWCQTMDGAVAPAEIGLTEFTIKDGISHSWHQLLRPEGLPLGYRYEIMLQKEKTHQIDPDYDGLSECFNDVFRRLVEILTVQHGEIYAGKGVVVQGFDDLEIPDEFRSAKTHRLLPLYVLPEQKTLVKKFLTWFTDQTEGDILFPLFDLSLLLAAINNSSDKNLKPMIPSVADSILSLHMVMYSYDCACKYHMKVESPNCASARATRQAQLFVNLTRQILDLPEGMDDKSSKTNPSAKSLIDEKLKSELFKNKVGIFFGSAVDPNGPVSTKLETDDVIDHPLHPIVSFEGGMGFDIDVENVSSSEFKSQDVPDELLPDLCQMQNSDQEHSSLNLPTNLLAMYNQFQLPTFSSSHSDLSDTSSLSSTPSDPVVNSLTTSTSGPPIDSLEPTPPTKPSDPSGPIQYSTKPSAPGEPSKRFPRPIIPSDPTQSYIMPTITNGTTQMSFRPTVASGPTQDSLRPAIASGATRMSLRPIVPNGLTQNSLGHSLSNGPTRMSLRPTVPSGPTHTSLRPSVATGPSLSNGPSQMSLRPSVAQTNGPTQNCSGPALTNRPTQMYLRPTVKSVPTRMSLMPTVPNGPSLSNGTSQNCTGPFLSNGPTQMSLRPTVKSGPTQTSLRPSVQCGPTQNYAAPFVSNGPIQMSLRPCVATRPMLNHLRPSVETRPQLNYINPSALARPTLGFASRPVRPWPPSRPTA